MSSNEITLYPFLGAHPEVEIRVWFGATMAGQGLDVLLLVTLLVTTKVQGTNISLLTLVLATILYGSAPWLFLQKIRRFNVRHYRILFDAGSFPENDRKRLEEGKIIHTCVHNFVSSAVWSLCTLGLGLANPGIVQHDAYESYCVVNVLWL
ncbi:hypothetical protein GLOTRDRAFT_90509 [Gloeophyllum trabeum ATCC 11539]|uniref:Uncharacterized protein n=1 Tax=Gloeophyllum trabeum (strain ATCC 11539 / FP-39264 / Madison 617) TaxID=670483 RepID=S7QP38_GLOTA|nr:uncharacterized protein GLOTRDRAFT_90509 [Gloeophyllum trabeum ATCC 11539]EPQ61293.1 hypothetical protein GLOTRDRAFT_90509 [Gloeophyllum trabeum ATCC 11539]